MYGTAVGKFNVYVKTGPGNTSDVETLVWSDSGNQGNSWIQSQAPVYSSKPFRVCFVKIMIKNDLDVNTYSFRIGGASAAASCIIRDSTISIIGRWSSDCYCRFVHFSNSCIVIFSLWSITIIPVYINGLHILQMPLYGE